jgi:hypothetical protein
MALVVDVGVFGRTVSSQMTFLPYHYGRYCVHLELQKALQSKKLGQN